MKIIITQKELAEKFIDEFQFGLFINYLTVISSFLKITECVLIYSDGKEEVIKLNDRGKDNE